MKTFLFCRHFETFLLFFIVLFFCFHFKTFSQNLVYSPASELYFHVDDFSEDKIAEKINETKISYKTKDIEDLKIAVVKNNNEVEQKILKIKNELSKIRLVKTEILNLADINKINEQIKEKNENLEKIKQEIKNDLSNISFKGFYIVVLGGINPYEQKEKMAFQAKKLLAPKAIEYLNGIFIQSVTKVENNITISDFIKSKISGEMMIELECAPTKVLRESGIFIYMVKVVVSPLKENIETVSASFNSTENSEIINLLTDKQYRMQLQKFSLSEEDISLIESEYQNSIDYINKQNSLIEETQKNIIEKGNISINKMLAEIEELNRQLANKSALLKEKIEKYTTVKYENNLINDCIKDAFSELDEKINILLYDLLKTKENELIIGQFNVTTEGRPEEDIAKTAINGFSQLIKTYGTVEKFIEEVTVENYSVNEYNAIQKSDLIRVPENIWLYPSPGNNNNFNLTIVVKFKKPEIKGNFHEFFIYNFLYDILFKNEEMFESELKFLNGKQSKFYNDYLNWKNSVSLFNEEAYVKVLSTDTLSFFEKEVISNNVRLNIIDFEKHKTYNFSFRKENDEWFVVEFDNASLNIKNTIDYEFIDFLIKFSKDSIFQVNHIKFPLQEFSVEYLQNSDSLNEENYDPFQIVNKEIERKDWVCWNLNIDNIIVFSNINKNSKYRNIHYAGISNGISSKLTFEKINEDWKLVKYEDYSN